MVESCLVTGASGFIGTALCKRLRADGYSVVAAGRRPNEKIDGLEWRAFDLGEVNWPDQLLEGVSHVFHLAAIAHRDGADAAQIERINHYGTARLASMARLSDVQSFVFVSSILAANPRGCAYASAKHHAERALMKCSDKPMRQVILRPPLVYGPGVGGNLGLIIRAVAQGWFPPPPPDLGCRPMIALDDLIEAIVRAGFAQWRNCEPIALCDGQHYSLRRLVVTLAESFDRRVPAWYLPRVFWSLAGFAGDALRLVPGLSSLPGRVSVRRMFSDVALPAAPPDSFDWQPKLRLDDCATAMCKAWREMA